MHVAKLLQSCLTVFPMNCSLTDSSVHGILQARILAWVAISFSRVSSWPRNQTQVFCIAGRFFTTVPSTWLLKISCEIQIFHFLFAFFFLLNLLFCIGVYSWLTMLWYFQVNSKGIQPYKYHSPHTKSILPQMRQNSFNPHLPVKYIQG